jgi:hypothetical protein
MVFILAGIGWLSFEKITQKKCVEVGGLMVVNGVGDVSLNKVKKRGEYIEPLYLRCLDLHH